MAFKNGIFPLMPNFNKTFCTIQEKVKFIANKRINIKTWMSLLFFGSLVFVLLKVGDIRVVIIKSSKFC